MADIKKEIKRWIKGDKRSDISHRIFNNGIMQATHRCCMGEKDPYKHMSKTEKGELECFSRVIEKNRNRPIEGLVIREYR